MAALIKEAGENFLRSKLVKGGKNMALPEHSTRAFSNFIKEKKIVSFKGMHISTLSLSTLLKSRDGPTLIPGRQYK